MANFAAPKKPKPVLKPTAEKPAPASNPYGIDQRALPYVQPSLNLIQSQEDTQKKALSDFTAAVLKELSGYAPAIGSDYNTAIDQSRSLAQAGADSLKGANGNAGIQSMLQAIGAPDSQQQQVTSQLGNVFNGGSAALFGDQGVYPGQQLIRDKASSQAFANELPGINALAGTAALKNLLSARGLDRQKVLDQVPGILGDLAKQDTAAKAAKADAAYKQQYLSYLGGQLGVKATQTKASIAQGNRRLDIAAQQAQTSAKRATDAASAAQQRITIAQQNANTSAKKASAKKLGKAPTAGQLNTLVDQWYGGKAGSVRKPVVDDKGKQKTNPSTGAPLYVTTTQRSGQLSYQRAFNRLKALNVPAEQAAALLDTKFQRGERGRPWLGFQERNLLKQAGTKVVAGYYKGHAFLTAAQASALEAANALPPGEVVNGRYFIQPGY